MIVVGSSVARAFAVVGAAGLVRYQSKISDPKDAAVMLSALAVGLASGVGFWMAALFSTAFVIVLLWLLESFEPTPRRLFFLRIKAKDPAAFKPKVEEFLVRHRINHELRATSEEEMTFEVYLPIERKTDRLTTAIVGLTPENEVGVEWEEREKG